MDKELKKNIEQVQETSYNFKDVKVYSMPKDSAKNSDSGASDADHAKKTGFIILVLGSVFLLIILAGAYYYFVAAGNKQAMSPQNANNIERDNKQNNSQVAEGLENSEPEEKMNENEMNDEQSNPEESAEDPADEVEEENISEDEIEVGEPEELLEESDTEPIEDDLPEINIVDSDMDGLSSKEEQLAGTSDGFADTDKDGFNDLAEMLNGYNPTGEGELSNSQNFQKFENTKYSYLFYYPTLFKIQASSEDAVIFDLGDEEFFQIFVDTNSKKLNIEDWYKAQFAVNLIDENLIFSKNDWQAVKSADRRSIFFKNNVGDYVIAFNYSSLEKAQYLNIFEVVFNSFKILN
ncbi:hypothetical protein C0584_05490 [Candidatus Parcubacteria bacterium]|nr:MAG: hypothetical protein C0584_05490 [Candidatus Parcubacteria bacterium]